jgi:hypothetical protein
LDFQEARLRPERGGPSQKLSLSFGESAGNSWQEFTYRPTFHDGLDRGANPPAFSEISILKVQLRHSEREDLQLHRAEILHIQSFNPIDVLQKKVSWTTTLAFDTPPDLESLGEKSGRTVHFDAGAGVSGYLLTQTENALVYAMLKANLESNHRWESSFRHGPSLKLGHFLRFTDKWRMGAHHEFFYFEQDSDTRSRYQKSSLGLSWSPTERFELRGHIGALSHLHLRGTAPNASSSSNTKEWSLSLSTLF